MLVFTSGISFSGVSEHIHLHGLDWLPLSVNDQSHFLSRFPAENLLAATRAHLRGDVFHENGFPVNLKNLTYEFCAGFRRTADIMTFEHGSSGYIQLILIYRHLQNTDRARFCFKHRVNLFRHFGKNESFAALNANAQRHIFKHQ